MATGCAEFARINSANSIEDAFLAVRHFSRPHWLDLLRRDQSERWQKGAGVSAERYFELLPELRQDREEALVLICGEVRSRRELGQCVALADYITRFPDLADALAIQFELDETFGNLTAPTPAPFAREWDQIQLPGFEVLRPLGRGATGRVFLARQLSVDRLVAVKAINAWHLDDSQVGRHCQEALILSRLKHPNVVQIYDLLKAEG